MATAHGATRSSLFGLDVFVGCWKLNCAHPNSQLRWHFRWKGEKGASSFPEEAAEYLDTLITMPTWMRMNGAPPDVSAAQAEAIARRAAQLERRRRLQAAASQQPPAPPPPALPRASPVSAETDGAISNHIHAASLAPTPASAVAAASRADSTSLFSGEEDEDPDLGGIDPNGENFVAAERFLFNDRLAYHMDGQRITAGNFRVVQFAILLEAGRIVTDMEKTTKEHKEDAMLIEFKGIADGIPGDMYDTQGVKAKLVEKLYNAQTLLNGKGLWDKYTEVRKETRKYWEFFPAGSSGLPSGTQWKQLVDRHKMNCFKKQFVRRVLFS